jgi:hypothetical protein
LRPDLASERAPCQWRRETPGKLNPRNHLTDKKWRADKTKGRQKKYKPEKNQNEVANKKIARKKKFVATG